MKSAFLSLAFLALALPGCSKFQTSPADLINNEASPPPGLPSNPLQWRVIDSVIDDRISSMSTLFGNDTAVEHARSAPLDAYPAGSVLALVTWEQQDDAHWFGAKIPGQLISIEWVYVMQLPDQGTSRVYERYEGTPLRKVSGEQPGDLDARTQYILNQKASVMPDGAQPVTTL